MLQLKRTTTINECTATTENATYEVRYTIIGSQLQTVSADIIIKTLVDAPTSDGKTVKQEQCNNIGRVSMEYGIFKAPNLPYSEKIPSYMFDFVQIVNEIITPAKE